MKDEMSFLLPFYALLAAGVAVFLTVMLLVAGLSSLFLVVVPLLICMGVVAFSLDLGDGR